MKGILGAGGLVLICALLSCKSTKKTTASGTSGDKTTIVKNISCAELVKNLPHPRLEWIQEDSSVLNNLTTLSRPSSFKVYSLDSVETKAFFQAIRDSAGKKPATAIFPLPYPVGCLKYSLADAGVMTKALQDKYPELVALKGTDQRGQSDLRLNYDGKWVKGQVNQNGQIYIINPVRNNGKIYYMIYDRAKSGDKKEPFEEKQPGQTR